MRRVNKYLVLTFCLCCLAGTASAQAKKPASPKIVSAPVASSLVEAAQEAKNLPEENVGAGKQLVPTQGSIKERIQHVLSESQVKETAMSQARPQAHAVAADQRLKYEDQYQYQHDSYDRAIANAYAYRRDFGKSNLIKWSSTEGMNTSWYSNYTTDTAHFKSSTVAFLDNLNNIANREGVSFVITGGAEHGYHASGVYSHENGYKVDISDDGVYRGSKAYEVLMEALSPFKYHLSHEWDKNHFDITIYPENYTGSYSGGSGTPYAGTPAPKRSVNPFSGL